MQTFRVLKGILRRTHTDRILIGFVIFFFLCAVPIWRIEPEIITYGDALWYCFAAITTIGFGDFAAATHAGRILTVLLGIYGIIVIALVTGVVVNFHTQIIQVRQKNTLAAFADKLERLPELSKEELEHLSNNVSKFRGDMPKKRD